MNSYKKASDTLDLLVQEIAKACVLVPQAGIMSGKIGIAILLYQYGRYKNNPKMAEYADTLMEFVLDEISLGVEKGFDNGLYGIIWGIDYLVKLGFIQAEEDIFDEIDVSIFCNKNKVYYLDDLCAETGKGLYVLSRFFSGNSVTEKKCLQHIENLISYFHDILISKYTDYILPVIPCKTLIRFFHICQTVWEYSQFRPEIRLLYEELPEIARISYKEEKSISEKYILATLLNEIPMFKGCISIGNITQAITLSNVNNFYMNQLVLGSKIYLPGLVNETILSILKNDQQIYGLLDQLNPNTIGLGEDIGGFAWTLMQWCMQRNVV